MKTQRKIDFYVFGTIVLALGAITSAPAILNMAFAQDIEPLTPVTCEEMSDVINLPDAANHVSNPHTCQQTIGDPHADKDNPDTANPHITNGE